MQERIEMRENVNFNLGKYHQKVDRRSEQWRSIGFADRLREQDPTLWSAEPMPELADRLGWIALGTTVRPRLSEMVHLAQEVRDEGARAAVLLGMGGSSLAPRVFQEVFGSKPGHPSLTVLDSTHPDAVREVRDSIEPSTTLFIISSKSGTTLETMSLFKFFWNEMDVMGEERGRHFIAVTDHGTPLARLASKRGFRRTFEASPNVGGRYSALTAFGLVPAALTGVDVHALLDTAFEGMEVGAAHDQSALHRGLHLGAALGELAVAGRDKVTILASSSVRAFPAWIEQLIAESTGKDGEGIVPVIDEPRIGPASYSPDRFFIGITVQGEEGEIEDRLGQLADAGHPTAQMRMRSVMDLGREMLDWEVAVAAAGAVLGINPFDQPDVQITKDLARKMMTAGGMGESALKDVRTISIDDRDALKDAFREWSSLVRRGDYISIQAYLSPSAETWSGLERVRQDMLEHLDVATTLGYGPGFLHSSGQLHKGGPNTGLFLQLNDDIVNDLDVPETDRTFGDLIRSSSLGDFSALVQRGRRVLRIDLGEDALTAIERLEREIVDLSRPKEEGASAQIRVMRR